MLDLKSKNKLMKKYIIAGCATLAIVSCSTTKKSVAVASASSTTTTSTLSAEQTATAKNLFETRCGKCHDLPDPAAHTVAQWQPIMDHMAPKAKLTDEEKSWVYQYVIASAKK